MSEQLMCDNCGKLGDTADERVRRWVQVAYARKPRYVRYYCRDFCLLRGVARDWVRDSLRLEILWERAMLRVHERERAAQADEPLSPAGGSASTSQPHSDPQ